MTPIETGRVFVCYVAIGVILDICVSQQHVKFDPGYGGAKPKLANFQCILSADHKIQIVTYSFCNILKLCKPGNEYEKK